MFVDRPNLSFVEGDLERDASLPLERPDAIVLASAIQYVADLPGLLLRLRDALAPGGEVHIVDSPLYAAGDVPAARERTRAHYEAIGVSAMADAVPPPHLVRGRALPAVRRVPPGRPRPAHGRPARPADTASPFPWLIIGAETAS